MGYCGRERFYARAALRSQSIMAGPRTFCQCLDSRAEHRRVGLVKMVVTVATWLGAGTYAQNCRGRRGRTARRNENGLALAADAELPDELMAR